MKRDMTPLATFGKERTAKKPTPKTLLDYDMQQADALGYGCHYGDYKADHPNTRADFERLTTKPRRENPNVPLVTCPNCGKQFVRGSRQTNKKYCSHECQSRYNAATQYKKKNPEAGETVACAICGAEFVSDHYHRVYCSKECYAEGQRRRTRRMREQRKKEAATNGNI